MDGHHLGSSHIIVGKLHTQFCRPMGILLHFMEHFNNMKGIHVCKLVCVFNKRTNTYSQWCEYMVLESKQQEHSNQDGPTGDTWSQKRAIRT